METAIRQDLKSIVLHTDSSYVIKGQIHYYARHGLVLLGKALKSPYMYVHLHANTLKNHLVQWQTLSV